MRITSERVSVGVQPDFERVNICASFEFKLTATSGTIEISSTRVPIMNRRTAAVWAEGVARNRRLRKVENFGGHYYSRTSSLLLYRDIQ